MAPAAKPKPPPTPPPTVPRSPAPLPAAAESSFDLDAMVGGMEIGGQRTDIGGGSAGGTGGAAAAETSGEPAVDPQQLASLLEFGFSEVCA